MYSYFLNEEMLAFQRVIRGLAEKHVRPLVVECDQQPRVPIDELRGPFNEAGLFNCYLPEEFGGAGGGFMPLNLGIEEISRICGGIALIPGATALGATPIDIAGSQAQKEKYLTRIATGEILAAFGLTEPDAGSDVRNMSTKAVEDGDHYVLNGEKMFITNAAVSDVFSIFAKVGSKISAFIVEKGTPGFNIGNPIHKTGIRASVTNPLSFADCRIPAENLLGELGDGLRIILATLDRTRTGIAAQALGIAQGAFELALAYAQQREQFRKPIIKFQLIQDKLARMATAIEAARALLYFTVLKIDAGEEDISTLSAMSKYQCSEVAKMVTDECVQIHGGYGFAEEFGAEKYWRDARITRIYEGTNEIQLLTVCGNIVKENRPRQIF